MFQDYDTAEEAWELKNTAERLMRAIDPDESVVKPDDRLESEIEKAEVCLSNIREAFEEGKE